MKLTMKHTGKDWKGEKDLVSYRFLSEAKEPKEIVDICEKIGGIGKLVRVHLEGEYAHEMDFGDMGEFTAHSVDEIKENLEQIEKMGIDDGYVGVEVDDGVVDIGFRRGQDGFVFVVSGTNIHAIKSVAEKLKEI